MRTSALRVLLIVGSSALAVSGGRAFGQTAATGRAGTLVTSSGAAGPQKSWMVVTLPNPAVTPEWRSFAPEDCQPDPSACANDHRFWEEWDFSAFRSAIDASFKAIRQQGEYQGVILVMPLADSPTFWKNIKLMFDSANAQGLQFQTAVFPKNKYGSERCYLYPSDAPENCAMARGTGATTAYESLLKLMNYVENLGGGCGNGRSNRPVAVWYGWEQMPGYDVLSRFWLSLPTRGCNLQASYATWLDTRYSAAPEVVRMQKFVTQVLKEEYWVDTELYGMERIQENYSRYAPYQTVITGFNAAATADIWAVAMCGKWNIAGRPRNLGVWTFSDRDIPTFEEYRAWIQGAMAPVGEICASSHESAVGR